MPETHIPDRRPFRGLAGGAFHRWVWLLVLLSMVATSVRAGAPTAADAWKEAAQLFVQDAHVAFAQLAPVGPAEAREVRLGKAVTWLELPPLTAKRVDRSAAALRQLIAENPDDEPGLAARYLLGRIRQLFAPEGERVAEPAELQELIRDHPDSAFAQLAMIKITLYQLYAPTGVPDLAQRFHQVAGFEHQITIPQLRRDYHLAVANAELFFSTAEPDALRHLQAALAIGIPSDTMRADVLVQIGELARDLGERGTAMSSYRRFLAENRHDVRILMVRGRLAALEAETGNPHEN